MRPGERLQTPRWPDGDWVTVAESEYCSDLPRVAFGLITVAGVVDEIRHELETPAGWILIGTIDRDGYRDAQASLFAEGATP